MAAKPKGRGDDAKSVRVDAAAVQRMRRAIVNRGDNTYGNLRKEISRAINERAATIEKETARNG